MKPYIYIYTKNHVEKKKRIISSSRKKTIMTLYHLSFCTTLLLCVTRNNFDGYTEKVSCFFPPTFNNNKIASVNSRLLWQYIYSFYCPTFMIRIVKWTIFLLNFVMLLLHILLFSFFVFLAFNWYTMKLITIILYARPHPYSSLAIYNNLRHDMV